MTEKKPNILVLQFDQLAPSMLTPYGNTVAKTPNIQTLAESSTVFENAYCNFPLCCPSRASMMTGQLPSTIAAYDNGSELAAAIPTFAHYVRDNGYQTTLCGKMHFVGPDQLHGFEDRITTDIYPADFGWMGDWEATWQPHNNDERPFTLAGPCMRNPQMDYDEEVLHRAERHLYNIARGEDERPFMLVTSFTAPHEPFQCAQRYWDRYDEDEIDMPTIGAIPREECDPFTQRLLVQYGLDKFQPSETQIHRARHAYYGMIAFVDDVVGRLMETLERCGFDDNTIVILTSDHGEMLGERGLWYKKSLYEQSVAVPMIIKHPDCAAARVKSNVSLVDLLPTLCELSDSTGHGGPIEPVPGQSLVPLLGGGVRDDDAVFVEYLAEGAQSPIMMIRHGDMKLITSRHDPDILFDLKADPIEQTNLVDVPEYAEAYAALLARVHEIYDRDDVEQTIIADQKKRKFLHRALKTGRYQKWDFVPVDQAGQNCLREGYADWCFNNTLSLVTE